MSVSGVARRWLVAWACVLTLVAGGATPVAAASPAEQVAVERYVAAVYRDLFGRLPDPEGLATWRSAILSGRPRVEVANAITSSVEYRSRLVTDTYARFLDRGPDSVGLRFWVAKMAEGWTVARIGAGFISSDEYYQQAGSTPAGWVTKLYADVLGRGAAPDEVGFWLGEISRGASRSQVAMGFLLSTEHLSTVVDGYYVHLLDRHLDPTGQQTWVSALQRGTHDEEIIGGIIASAEYWAANAGVTPTRIFLRGQPSATAGQPVTFTLAVFDDLLGVQLADVPAAEARITIDGSAAPCTGTTCTVTAAGRHAVGASWRGLTTSGSVDVVPGPPASLVLTPATASVANGASVVFSAAGRDAYGNATSDQTTGAVFAVDGDRAACVAARCRPSTPGAHQVTAALASAPGVTGSATIQVAAPGPVRYRAFEWGGHHQDEQRGGAVVGSTAQWASSAVGERHAIAIRTDGSLWSWGSNSHGELGDGTMAWRDVPEQVGTRTDWTWVSAGSSLSLAVAADGSLWGWGEDFRVLGSSTIQTSPKRIGTDADWASVSAGLSFALAMKRDGSLWAWGENAEGQLGDGTTTVRRTPVRVGTDTWSTVAAGVQHAVGVRSDGSLWAWGVKDWGWWTQSPQLIELTPTRIGADSDWRTVAAGFGVSAAIRSDGSLWTWGYYTGTGQLGDGTLNKRLDPVQVGVGTTWSTVAFGGYHTVALDAGGGLWRWGSRDFAAPGDPDVLVPERVGAETGWVSVSPGYDYTVALRP